MFKNAVIFWLWLATTNATGLSSQIMEEENRMNSGYMRILSDIVDNLPHEECDMIVASSWLPRGEMKVPTTLCY